MKVASGTEDEVIDLDFVHSLISNGASVHTTDRHGQSVLHEAARDWDLGIAEFLLDNGKLTYFVSWTKEILFVGIWTVSNTGCSQVRIRIKIES